MQRSFSALLLALLFVGSIQVARAAHYSGGSLTYTCIGNNFYRFHLDLYLDCTGLAITPQRLNFTNDCGVVFSINNLPVTFSEDVSQLCPASAGNSTCDGGVYPGVRHYRFETTVFLSPCNDWSVAWDICCRNTMENLFLTPGMYIGATVNNAGGVCDRSPTIADNAIPFVCVNEPVLYNAGFSDPDGDRMSFSLIDARFALPAPTPVQYQNGFSGAEPIPGIVLDQATGQLSFTPTVTGNYVVVIEVTTYNAANVPIGTVFRDLMMIVVNCAGSPPVTAGPTVVSGAGLVGDYGLAVCDGVPFCVDIAFSDGDPGAVIALASNATALLPGATFTVVGNDPAVGTLCWTPSLATRSRNVRITATDDACPIQNVASVSLLINVAPAPTVFPDAGSDGSLTACPGGPPVALFGGLGGTPDGGGSWSFMDAPHGPNFDPLTDLPGDYVYTVTGASPCASASATVSVGLFENSLILELQNDINPGPVTWEILDESGTSTVDAGSNVFPANAIGTQTICLGDGCYRLRVTDGAGDGSLGYVLRESGQNGRRFIDNTANMSTGVSQIANGGSFCVPMGDIDLIYSNCDKLDWVSNKYLVCHADPAVSAVWVPGGANNVQNGGTGYAFWIFDPNGSYSFRRFHAHNTSDGYSPATATRAAHLKLNGWSNGPLTPHVPANVLMNVRVRPVVLGSLGEWGPTCRMMIDPARAACPLVNLQDDPANPSDYSCGVTRIFGGPNASANRIVADPPQFQPAPLAGGTGLRYQFRFRIPGENQCIVRPPQTSPTLYLNWNANSGPQLEASKTYEVEVRVSKDQGATWCVDAPSPACDPSPVTTWGKTCNVTISGVVQLTGGSNSIATHGNGTLTMYPNPNKGEQLFISLTELAPEVNTVSVDIYDLTGKRITARTIAVQDGFLNTTFSLNGDVASGLYMVNITAGDKAWTERLVIQR